MTDCLPRRKRHYYGQRRVGGEDGGMWEPRREKCLWCGKPRKGGKYRGGLADEVEAMLSGQPPQNEKKEKG